MSRCCSHVGGLSLQIIGRLRRPKCAEVLNAELVGEMFEKCAKCTLDFALRICEPTKMKVGERSARSACTQRAMLMFAFALFCCQFEQTS